MKGNLLQSHAWERYSELEGHPTYWLESSDYQLLAVQHHTPLGDYLYCPYGPVLDETNPLPALKHALAALNSLAKAHHAFFVRIEPTYAFPASEMANLGLIKSHDLDPAHTWVIDLTQPTDDILRPMDKNKTRLWRHHTEKGFTLRSTTDPEQITILTSLLSNVSQRNHFTPQDTNHLKHQLEAGFATLYVAETLPGAIPDITPTSDSAITAAPSAAAPSSPIPVAAALVYDYDGTRYYAHAAADDAYRKLMPGAILLVQMILDAKAQGAHTFDFWGITTSDDPHHPWYGFTKFKKSFGGHQVDHSGTWDLPINKFRYRLYLFLRRLNRLSHKK